MRSSTNGTATVATVVLALVIFGSTVAEARVVLGARGPGYRTASSSHELVFEGGLAEPMGDQDAPYFDSLTGFGSGTGYQVGVRWRQYLSGSFAVSPAFHYTRFGTDDGVIDSGNQRDLAYSIRTSNYRYAVDFQAFVGGWSSPVRLFLTGGIALVNNRYRDELQFGGVFKQSVNTPAYSAGLGLKMRSIELVGEYTFNRFDTTKFDYDGVKRSYDWNYLIVRAAISFGR